VYRRYTQFKTLGEQVRGRQALPHTRCPARPAFWPRCRAHYTRPPRSPAPAVAQEDLRLPAMSAQAVVVRQDARVPGGAPRGAAGMGAGGECLCTRASPQPRTGGARPMHPAPLFPPCSSPGMSACAEAPNFTSFCAARQMCVLSTPSPVRMTRAVCVRSRGAGGGGCPRWASPCAGLRTDCLWAWRARITCIIRVRYHSLPAANTPPLSCAALLSAFPRFPPRSLPPLA